MKATGWNDRWTTYNILFLILVQTVFVCFSKLITENAFVYHHHTQTFQKIGQHGIPRKNSLVMRKGSANSAGRRSRSYRKRTLEEGGKNLQNGVKKISSNGKGQSPSREFESRKGAKKMVLLEMTGTSASTWKHKKLEDDWENVDNMVAAYSRGSSRKYSGNSKSGRGRSRSVRKEGQYQALAAYKTHFMSLIKEEMVFEKNAVLDRLKTWPEERLAKEGYSIFGLAAQSKGLLFKDHVFRFSLPRKGNFVPSLPFNQLSAGDFATVTGAQGNPIDELSEVAEVVILQATPLYIDVCIKDPPQFLTDAVSGSQQQTRFTEPSKTQTQVIRSGKGLFRLDLFFNSVSYERMAEALDGFTDPDSDALGHEIQKLLLKSMMYSLPELKSGDKALRSGLIDMKKSQENSKDLDFAMEAQRRITKDPGYNSDVSKAVKALVESGEINNSQARAIHTALTRRVTLIQGPPGTGKTRTSCLLLKVAAKLQQERGARRQGKKILATAFSNVAADNLLEGLLKLGLKAVRIGRVTSVRRELWPATLDYILEKNPQLLDLKARVQSENQASRERQYNSERQKNGKFQNDKDLYAKSALKTAYEAMQEAEKAAIRKVFREADVVVCSCIGGGHEAISLVTASGPELPPPTSFPTVLIDEAAQANEPATLVPILRGCEQLILVGDQNQLPPTVVSSEANLGGLGLSLFSRLITAGVQPVLLNRQYRMHPRIAEFSSMQFYGNKVRSNPKPEERLTPSGFLWPQKHIPVCFVQVTSEDGETYESTVEDGSMNTSIKNEREAQVVCRIVKDLVSKRDISYESIGVITPYSAQVKQITDSAPKLIFGATTTENDFNDSKQHEEASPAEINVSKFLEIKSVDGYQGREKELILISAVRSNKKERVGFLSDWRRLNVAVTRAKRGLIVVGDPQTLKSDSNWKAFIDWCVSYGVIVDGSEILPL